MCVYIYIYDPGLEVDPSPPPSPMVIPPHPPCGVGWCVFPHPPCGVVWWGYLGRRSDAMMEAKLKGVIKFGETQIEQIEYFVLNVFLCVDRRWLHSCAPAQ